MSSLSCNCLSKRRALSTGTPTALKAVRSVACRSNDSRTLRATLASGEDMNTSASLYCPARCLVPVRCMHLLHRRNPSGRCEMSSPQSSQYRSSSSPRSAIARRSSVSEGIDSPGAMRRALLLVRPVSLRCLGQGRSRSVAQTLIRSDGRPRVVARCLCRFVGPP